MFSSFLGFNIFLAGFLCWGFETISDVASLLICLLGITLIFSGHAFKAIQTLKNDKSKLAKKAFLKFT